MRLFGIFGSKKPKLSATAQEALEKIALMSFPGGEKQITEETNQLHTLLRGKLPKAEVRQLLARMKALIIIAEDKTQARILRSIQTKIGDKLTADECKIVCQFLTGILGDLYGDADGFTKDTAVVINTTSSVIGIDAEYKWLTARYGKQGEDWTIEMRMHSQSIGRTIETFVINLENDRSKTIHFDISSFYGRS